MNASESEVAKRGRQPRLRKAAVVRDYLLAELAAGRLKPGTAIPPEVALAEGFGISRQTVRRALAEMNEEGIIRREQGRGTFVNEGIHRQIRQGANSFGLMVVGMLPAALPLLCGFQKACQMSQDQAVLYDSENSVDKQGNVILGILYGGVHISGLAMLPAASDPTPSYHVAALQDRGVPVVLCHRGVSGAQAPLLAVSYEDKGRVAGSAVAKFGHRRAGLFCSFRSLGLDLQIRGFREAMQANGGDLPEEFVHQGQAVSLDLASREREVAEAVKRLVDVKDRPTAIWVASTQDAELFYLMLQKSGLRVPQDVSLLTTLVDENPQEPFLRMVSSVVVPDAEVGRRAVELLDEMKSGKRSINDNSRIVVPLGWHAGQTLGPSPQSAAACSGGASS